MVNLGGIGIAAASAVCNGSFGVFSKIKQVQDAQVPPMVFNFWVCVGIVVSSLPLAFYPPLVFTPWGLLSGVFFVASMSFTLQAIQALGLSSASGIWSGTAVIVSFAFAVLIQGDDISSIWMASVGLIALILGFVGIAANGQVASRHREQEAALQKSEAAQEEGLLNDGEEDSSAMFRKYLQGVLVAVAAGLFGGLVLAPKNWADPRASGANYMPSMAAGVLLSAPLVTGACFLASREPLRLSARAAAGPGILAGAIWNLGNVFSILASEDPGVGLAIAYPIFQCGLFVAGLWGIILFHELRGKEQILYWVGGAVLFTGAVLLTLSK